MSRVRTESHRRSDARYNAKRAESTKLIGVRIPNEMAEALKNECSRRGVSQAAVLKAAIEKFLSSPIDNSAEP